VTTSNDGPRPESPTSFDPNSIVDSLLSEAESRQREESEARTGAAERARRLTEQMAMRERLRSSFDRAYAFPDEEDELGHKPRTGAFRRWADRLLELGAVLRECDEAIERLYLVEKLRKVAARPTPAAMKYACALLLLASEGKVDEVAFALEKSSSDRELCRFVLWLRFIFDRLWYASPEGNRPTQIAGSPAGTSLEENEQAEQAFDWRPNGLSFHKATAVDNRFAPVTEGSVRQDPLPDLASDPIKLTITQAAKFVGVSDRTIREWRRNGKLNVVMDEDGHLVFSKSELQMLRDAR
jgi:excisionase family DNA binding protein